ncbi:MAG: LPS assembly lipoprotein LptE [Candidatus Arsenophonus melophagi]|nr:LPS assembly lipoprotein LptE [Candidatus Arsenophonus melophagi]
MRYLRTLFLSLTVLLITSCGFHLKGTENIAEKLKMLKFITDEPYGQLARAIRQELRLNNINLIYESFKNVPILKILSSFENTQTVSIHQNGHSAEKQLNFWVSAQMMLPNGAIFPMKIRVERTFFDNSLTIVIKDSEREFLKEEMCEQAARQLISKLLIIHGNMQTRPEALIAVKNMRSDNSE